MNFVQAGATGFALLTAVAVSGCAGGGSAPAPQPAVPPQSAVQIQSPKDARAVQLCGLLPPAAAQSLQLSPQGEEREDSLDSNQPPVCEWKSAAGDPRSLSLRVDDMPIAPLLNQKPSTWGDYAKLNIAGYPAVRGNMGDPATSGFCGIYMATQENQMLVSNAALPGNEVGKTDACQIAQQGLEAAVASLPPAK